MNQKLQDLLAEYLGQLLHQQENEFDWIEKGKIIIKINAVNELLGIPGKIQTPLERIIKVVDTMTGGK